MRFQSFGGQIFNIEPGNISTSTRTLGARVILADFRHSVKLENKKSEEGTEEGLQKRVGGPELCVRSSGDGNSNSNSNSSNHSNQSCQLLPLLFHSLASPSPLL